MFVLQYGFRSTSRSVITQAVNPSRFRTLRPVPCLPKQFRGYAHLTKNDIDRRTFRQTINSVASGEIKSETAVQEMMNLVRYKPYEEIDSILEGIWRKSLAVSSVSQQSARAVTEFLASLSKQSQYNTSGLIRIWNARLWRDMPRLSPIINRLWNNLEVPQSGLARKVRIDKFVEDVYFTSLLFRSSQPAFIHYKMFLFWSFHCGLDWPVDQFKRTRFESTDEDAYRREAFDIWVPAMNTQMDAAGPELMDTISSEPLLGTKDRLTVGRWRFWQQRLLKIAADKKIDLQLRQMARQTSERMVL